MSTLNLLINDPLLTIQLGIIGITALSLYRRPAVASEQDKLESETESISSSQRTRNFLVVNGPEHRNNDFLRSASLVSRLFQVGTAISAPKRSLQGQRPVAAH